MGILLHGERFDGSVWLRPRHLVGRAGRCDLQLAEPSVSGEHALLVFDQGCWWVRDLGSRNGTKLDGKALSPGQSGRLQAGSQLAFGRSGPWLLRDDGPPVSRAIGLDGADDVALSAGMIALPSEQDPDTLITQAVDGGWVAQRETGDEPVEDGDVVSARGKRYRLALSNALTTTQSVAELSLTLQNCAAVFRVPPHEESIQLALSGPHQQVVLDPRAHHYTLLHLSRLRRADAERGVAPAEQGWIDRAELAGDLKLAMTALNVHLYRARRAFAQAGVAGAEDLIERRGREIRLALARTSEASGD